MGGLNAASADGRTTARNVGSWPCRRVDCVISTLAGVALELSGLYLWRKRKAFKVRMRAGWKLALFDLHHLAGIVGFPLMLTLAVTGGIMALAGPEHHPQLRKVSVYLHTGRQWPWPIKLVYLAATTGFMIQGVTGLVMWWRVQDRPASRR